jgi:hypothetical protein
MATLQEIADLIDQKNKEQLEKIKAIIINAGLVRSLTNEINTAQTPKIVKGTNDNTNIDIIARINLKDIKKVKGVSDFLQEIIKSNIGDQFLTSIMKLYNLTPESQEMKQFDAGRKIKTTRDKEKCVWLFDNMISKNNDHFVEATSIMNTYIKNAAANIYVLPSTFYIGCNDDMVQKITELEKNNISMKEDNISASQTQEIKNAPTPASASTQEVKTEQTQEVKTAPQTQEVKTAPQTQEVKTEQTQEVKVIPTVDDMVSDAAKIGIDIKDIKETEKPAEEEKKEEPLVKKPLKLSLKKK